MGYAKVYFFLKKMGRCDMEAHHARPAMPIGISGDWTGRITSSTARSTDLWLMSVGMQTLPHAHTDAYNVLRTYNCTFHARHARVFHTSMRYGAGAARQSNQITWDWETGARADGVPSVFRPRSPAWLSCCCPSVRICAARLHRMLTWEDGVIVWLSYWSLPNFKKRRYRFLVVDQF